MQYPAGKLCSLDGVRAMPLVSMGQVWVGA